MVSRLDRPVAAFNVVVVLLNRLWGDERAGAR